MIKNEPLPTIDIPDIVDDRSSILSTLSSAEDHLRDVRAELAQLYSGTHVDARYLVKALTAARLARTELDRVIHDQAVKARDLAVPWSVIGEALGTSKQNAYQRHGSAG